MLTIGYLSFFVLYRMYSSTDQNRQLGLWNIFSIIFQVLYSVSCLWSFCHTRWHLMGKFDISQRTDCCAVSAAITNIRHAKSFGPHNCFVKQSKDQFRPHDSNTGCHLIGPGISDCTFGSLAFYTPYHISVHRSLCNHQVKLTVYLFCIQLIRPVDHRPQAVVQVLFV